MIRTLIASGLVAAALVFSTGDAKAQFGYPGYAPYYGGGYGTSFSTSYSVRSYGGGYPGFGGYGFGAPAVAVPYTPVFGANYYRPAYGYGGYRPYGYGSPYGYGRSNFSFGFNFIR